MYELRSVPPRGQSRTEPTRRFAAPVRDRGPRVVPALFQYFARLWKVRCDRLRLAEMDDHLLADIGVARDDIRVALGEPRWLGGARR